MKKTIGVSLVVVGLVIGGYFGFLKYRESNLMAAISPLLKNGSIRVNDSVLIEIDPGNITFGEAIKKLDENTSEIDKKIIEVQSLDAAVAPAIQSSAVEYLRSAQALTRSLAGLNRKAFSLHSAKKHADEELKEMRASSGYSVEYAVKSARRANDDYRKAIAEYTEQLPEMCDFAKNFKEHREKFLKNGMSENVINLENLDKLLNKCKTDADSGEKKK